MQYIKGDIIEAFENNDIDIIIHQCNCTAGHGKGIAKVLSTKYPEINIPHIWVYKGDYKPILVGNSNKWIINMYTQVYPGAPTKDKTDSFETRLKWLDRCLKGIAYSFRYKIIGMPLIASGLAADKEIKGSMSDLEYFKAYIAPTVEKRIPNAVIYFL